MAALTALALALLLPWLLALAVGLQAGPPAARRLAHLAPVPALILALAAPDGLQLDIPWLLLGSRFALDGTGRVFLGVTALVWLLAGWFARGYLAGDPRRHRFLVFFLITQAGNLGVCLAADAASFYLFFAVMTFAAYGLVLHTGSREAHRAGRVYLAMAVLGEAALVAGMLLAVRAAGSHHLVDLAAASPPASAVWLLVVGFGIKAGVPLLHMWLPLAHPVAPVPASAVLSGVMLKAGLLGWLRFLPLGGEALPEVGTTLMVAGLGAMFLGVAAGLAQRDAKVLLAYSSVSQMGFMTLGVGAGLAAPALWPALLPAVAGYAVHHALAKSALFLGVGVAGARGGRRRLLVGMALPALALAGAPLSSGMWAKLQLKTALGGLPPPWQGLLAWLLPLAALATGLLMARLLILVAAREARGDAAGLALPWWGLILAGMAAPFWLASADTRVLAPPPLVLALALAPVLLAWGLAHVARGLALRGPAIPPGDLLVLLERLGGLPAWRGVKHRLGRI